MHMIAHQYIGMQRTAIAQKGLTQALQVTPPVLVIEEAKHAVVAALHYMLRNAGEIGARSRAMCATITYQARRHDQLNLSCGSEVPAPESEASLTPFFLTVTPLHPTKTQRLLPPGRTLVHTSPFLLDED